MRGRALLLFVAAFACSSSEEGAPAQGDGIELSLATRVPAGTEQLRCQLVQMPASETFIVGATHRYSVGSHHMLVFKTDFTSIPAELAGIHDCYEEGMSLMSHIRGVVYGSQQPTGELVYPAGVGLPVAPGAVLMLQAHYLNAQTRDLDADVRVTLRTAPGDTIQQRAGTLFFYDPFIHVPAHASARANMSCVIQHPVTLITATSHMHARGVGYAAYLDTPAAKATAPFYATDSWDHPSGWEGPMAIAAGDVVRFQCQYQNDGDHDFFQGQSAATNEMCMFVGVYYPAMTMLDEFCAFGPHDFGAGTASCLDTLSCVGTCPPGSAPGPDLILGQADVSECWQRCFADSCTSAWEPMREQLDCIQTRCADACSAPGSSGCVGCLTTQCAGELGACAAATCSGG